MDDDDKAKIQTPLLDGSDRNRSYSLQGRKVSERNELEEPQRLSGVDEPQVPAFDGRKKSEYEDLEAELEKRYDEHDDDMLTSSQASHRDSICKAYLKNDQIQNKTYNPYMIPPDWEMAEDHFKAVSIGVPVKMPPGQPINVDEMSGRPVEVKPLPLCSSRFDLNFLGPAYPMYFQFLIFALGLLLLMFLFSGAFGIYSNYQGDFCRPVSDYNTTDSSTCVLTSASVISLANTKTSGGDSHDHKDTMEEYHHLQRVFNIIAYIVLIIFFQYFRYRQKITAKIIDDRDTSIADYTFEVKNIPKIPGADMRKEVWKFVEENALPGQKLDVKKVVCCFDVADKMTVEAEIETLCHQKAKLIQRKQKGELVDNELQYTSTLIRNLKQTLKKMEKDSLKGDSTEFVGIAYVTVNTQQQYWDVINRWKKGYLQKWRENRRSGATMKMKNKFITIRPAPEPSDVFWENLGVCQSRRLRNRMLVNLVCAGILGLCFGGVFLIYDVKSTLITKVEEAHEGTIETVGVKAVSYLASFVIVIINYVLQFLIRKLVFWEKPASWTDYYTSVALKLAWAQFMNTSMITFAVAWFTNNYWGPGGMIESIIYVFTLNAFYTPIYNLVNIWYLLGKYSRSKARSLDKKSNLTQKQAMLLYENPKMDFATFYSGIIKSMFSAAFYSPVVPIVLLWTFLGIFLCYWVDKYNLLRKTSIGRALGVEIAFEMTEVMEWFLVIFGFSNFVFDWFFFKEISALTYILLVLAIVNAVFPMDWLNGKIFGKVQPEVLPETYDECKYYLDEEYDRFNPATKEVAIAQYAKMMQQDGTSKQFEKFMKKNKLI